MSQYIKEALSDLQPYTINDYSWFKGKFYTKELYLVEKYDCKELNTLLDLLITDGSISNVISIGLADSLNINLKPSDILINDYPSGSCQKLMDRFLNCNQFDEAEEMPLRIFAGTIVNEISDEQIPAGLTCIDRSSEELLSALQKKGLFTLAIRIIAGEDNSSELENEIKNNVIPKLLLLLKQTVEQVS